MKTYCPECGTKMEYVGKMPNFCTNCGFALNKAMQASNRGESGERGETGVPAEENEEKASGFDYDGITGIEVDIIQDQPSGGDKISDIVGTLPEDYVSPTSNMKAKRGRPKSKKRILSDFKQDAGSIRPDAGAKE